MSSSPSHTAEAHPARVNRRAALRLAIAAPVFAAIGVAGQRGTGGRTLGANQNTSATPIDESTACAGSPVTVPAASPSGTPVAAVTVTMTTQLRFDPEQITIKVGNTVVWKNDSILPHTATGDPVQNPVATSHPEYVRLPEGAEPWGSELLQPADSYSHTFTTPGDYDYMCIPHVLSGMRGTIMVEC